MNSLEALEELSLMINREKHINSEWNKKINDLKQTIKQDLEAYEQLKKENQELIVNKNVAQAVALNQKREIAELKDQISYLKEDGEEWQSAYEWSQTENSILKSENEELRSKYNDLMLDFNTLKQENDKLKKAIEILKDYLKLEVDIDTRTIITDVGDTSIVGATKDDVEDLLLLNEVLS